MNAKDEGQQDEVTTSANERQYFVIRYSSGPWHRLFINQQFVGDCKCEDGNHFPRDWTWPPALNALQQQVTELEGKAARYEEALRAVADDWATPPHLAELIRVLLPASPSTDYPMWAGDYYQGDSDALREAMNQKDDSTAATEGGEGA